MANTVIKSLNYATEIQVDGKSLKIDFSDKALVNKVLKLIKKYQNIEGEINKRIEEINNTEMDDLDRLIAMSDIELDCLQGFKHDVDLAFNAPVSTTLFGDSTVPPVERWFEFFEQITPIIAKAKEEENNRITAVQKKYGLDRLNEVTNKKDEAEVVPFEKKEG